VVFSFAQISCHALDDLASHASCADPNRALEVCAVGNTTNSDDGRWTQTLEALSKTVQHSLSQLEWHAMWLDNLRCILHGSSCGRGRILWKATVC
jgi:hypothetical protein